MSDWRALLEERVKKTSQSHAARELDVSTTLVSQVLSGSYKANTEKFARKVMAIYGQGGTIACPVRGPLEPLECADTYRRARKVGLSVGNAATFKQHLACRKCGLRGD
jgi:hypothetical protein